MDLRSSACLNLDSGWHKAQKEQAGGCVGFRLFYARNAAGAAAACFGTAFW